MNICKHGWEYLIMNCPDCEIEDKPVTIDKKLDKIIDLLESMQSSELALEADWLGSDMAMSLDDFLACHRKTTNIVDD